MSLNRRLKYEPLTIKEPQKYDVKIFNDTDEFTEYYRSHEPEFKNVSTLILNRTYKIPGYRISIVKKGTDNEELILKKDYYGNKTVKTDSIGSSNDLTKLTEQIDILTQRIDNIESFLAQLK